jgi:putrescine transport system permease protein
VGAGAAALRLCLLGGREPFVWGGFSLRWFAALGGNERLLEAAWLSLRVAAGAATLAMVLGGAAGWVLARHGRFRGRALFGALAGAPLILPEVVLGLALLLGFVALQSFTGWPAQRGAGDGAAAPRHARPRLRHPIVVQDGWRRWTGLEEAALWLGRPRARGLPHCECP